ncbi:ATP-grasp domain-containing protein [Parendozoicomonas haliclonae]|uniref:ATP-grasp domain-containing protein n=1 Tax=Parendozoicomonas haliclonae TaxID=1960125 RepID=A0A1X7AQY7_9GAMM|nr:hypothetical protein [Parendozoicomonas haliclonae]SMA50542.1 hypothetical protein EHSB41UT_04353 [Parendozoicomonas haliclonae]
MKALFLCGLPDSQMLQTFVDDKGKMQQVISGTANVFPFLNQKPEDVYQRFYLSGHQEDQKYTFSFWPDVIFNEISDADTHVNALKKAAGLCQQQNCPVINHPVAVLNSRRDKVSKKLVGIDRVIMPETSLIQPRSSDGILAAMSHLGLEFPVIIRKAGDHGGKSTFLLRNEQEVQMAANVYALDGSLYYLTPFVDYRSADGLYRKYRIAMVGGKAFLRHMIISDHWMIHSSSRTFMNEREDLIREEAETLQIFQQQVLPQIQEQLAAIEEAMQLDYFGIDCHVTEAGELLVFEVNASMNMLVNPNPDDNGPRDQSIGVIKSELERLILERGARKQ